MTDRAATAAMPDGPSSGRATSDGRPAGRATGPAVRVGALLFALFALFSSGTTGSGDAMIRYQVARAFVAHGDIALDAPNSQTVVGRGGRIYTIYGVGQSALFLIAEIPVRAAFRAAGFDPDRPACADVSVAVSCVVVLPLVSALGMLCLCLLLRELGLGDAQAARLTLLVAVASPILPYAKFHQEENQIVALTFACAYFCVRFGRTERARDAVAAAVLCWVPMWFRPTALAESVPLACLLLAAIYGARNRRAGATGFAVLAAGGALTAAWLLFLNWYRFGSVLETGYAAIYRENGFDHGSVVQGLLGPFIHPSKSVFLYSPLLVLALVGARRAWRDRASRRILLAGLSILALSVAIPARFKMWGGDTSWGPRYEIAGQALLLVVSALTLARRPAARAPLARAGVAAAVCLGVAMQLVGASLNYNLDYNRGLKRTWDFASISEWYDLSRAQLPLRVDSLVRYAHKWVEPPAAAPADPVDEYSVPAFLPWKLGQRFGPRVWAASLAVWAIALLAWAGVAWLWLARPRSATGRGPRRPGRPPSGA
jgi:hypothetical protein